MSEPNNKLLIGSLLQNAGLISAEQLQRALEVKEQYTQMKLGEILVLQQGLKAKTIDFFVDKWQEVLAQGQILPLGYYLNQASLLSDGQIKIILHEQKHRQEKFGELAVEKGWIKRDTIDFFLENLPSQPPKIMSLGVLEEYNSQALHLEKKYANYSLILSRILAWTGGIPVLTKTICQVFAKSDSNIPGGQEIKAVDRFVEGTLIRKWRTDKAGSSIRTLASGLFDNPRCDSISLLKKYQSILLAGEKTAQNSQEEQELLRMGLILSAEDRVKVSNIIYQQIFDREFIVDRLSKLQPDDIGVADGKPALESSTQLSYEPQPEIQIVPLAAKPIEPARIVVNNANNDANNSQEDLSPKPQTNSPEPLTKIGSIIVGVAIALLIPLFLTINNYYSSLSNSGKKNSTPKQVERLQQSCSQLNTTDLSSLLNAIANLESTQQQLQQDFPDNCEVALNRLRVMAAPQLGRESRILEAIRYLCKVPASSDVYIEAEVWLKRWYNSANWGQETQTYLEETDKYDGTSCPAAHFTEYEI